MNGKLMVNKAKRILTFFTCYDTEYALSDLHILHLRKEV